MCLSSIIDERIYRFGDDIFTVIRDPYDRAISMVNYMMSVMCDTSDPLRPDRREWMRRLNIERMPARPTKKFLSNLAHEIIADGKLLGSNEMCKALGEGDAGSSLDSMARSNIEITDIGCYDAWLRVRWGIRHSERLNRSMNILRKEDLSPDEVAYIADITTEDRELYQTIAASLRRSGEVSIRGIQVG